MFHVQSWPRAARRWTRGTARDDTNAAGEHHNMTGFWRAGHCDNRLLNGFGETPHRTRKTPRIKNQRSRVCALRLILVQPLNVSQTWRVRAQSERARSKTAHDRAPAHRFRTSQRTLRSRSKRTRSAKQRKTSQHHTEKCATSE